jgi:hypothetical protein
MNQANAETERARRMDESTLRKIAGLLRLTQSVYHIYNGTSDGRVGRITIPTCGELRSWADKRDRGFSGPPGKLPSE